MSDSAGERRPIDCVEVVAKVGPPAATRIAGDLIAWLQRRGIRVHSEVREPTPMGSGESAEPSPTIVDGVDLVIVAGGDGTFLAAARSAAPRGIPVLGVNLGSLGFLAELNPDELFAGLDSVLEGRYTIEERQLLRVRQLRNGAPGEEHAVVNDAVLSKSALARMIRIRVEVDGDHVATYTSDGLIVATATGSTAYALSAGGPILDPRVNAFVLAPICPHTMTYRPLVVPGTVTIDVSMRDLDDNPDTEVYLTLDGQLGSPFTEIDRLIVDSHPRPLRLVRVSGRGFFEVLRRKLRWGAR